jgi:hypothetical protein
MTYPSDDEESGREQYVMMLESDNEYLRNLAAKLELENARLRKDVADLMKELQRDFFIQP